MARHCNGSGGLCLPSSSSSQRLWRDRCLPLPILLSTAAFTYCQRPSPPAPPHSISSLPLQKPLPDSWKLLLAGVACGSSYFSSKRRFSTNVSFFTGFVKKKGEDVEELKRELYKAISALDRGADATPEDRQRVDQIASKLEAVNKVKEPLKSELLNGKWELLYTTSQTLLQTQRPRFLRPNGKIFQAINVDTLRAQNMETWPFYNQATANLVPLNAKRVAVKFDFFRIAGLIPIKNPGSGRGQLEIKYLGEELRISKGDRGNLFILKMVDPSYRVPL